ncbi:MAG: isochorismate synthase [Chlamydiales bacterium]|nr:isochorismate synthase [Chlamydiales bacterium]
MSELLDWLDEQTLYPKFYWRSEKEEIAAAGALRTFDHLPPLDTETPSMRLFGGRAFSLEEKEDGTWKGFPRQLFFEPKLLLIKKREDADPYTHAQATPLTRSDTPPFACWEKGIEKCLDRIKSKELSKLVTARRSTFTFEKPLSALDLLKALQNSPSTTLFAFQPDSSSAFIGSSPEKLYRREGRNIFTHALAGTRRRGKSEEEETELERELLASEKETREFMLVKESILSALGPLCSNFEFEKGNSVHKSLTVQHLVSLFSGTLLNQVGDSEIIRLLHPTAAVGGTPRDEALKLLPYHEDFDRGWYAGPIGWASTNSAEFAVGIRSALVKQNQLHLFAGTGIVDGSCPHHEWQELEQKIAPFTRLWSSTDDGYTK